MGDQKYAARGVDDITGDNLSALDTRLIALGDLRLLV